MSKMDQKTTNRLYILKISLVASAGGFLFGYDFVIISGALSFLDATFHLSNALKGLAMSSAVLGAISGPLLGVWFADRLGRRKTMMMAAGCFMVSTFGCVSATSILTFSCWRFLGGVGVGLAMMTSPIYIAELAPPDIRGRLVNVNQLSNVIGINLAVIVSYIFSFDGWGWRWMFASQAVPVTILILGLLTIPESPRWLAARDRSADALRILARINGMEKATQELMDIEKELKQESGKLNELFQPGIKLALLIGIILMIFSQINGVNVTMLYAPSIMAEVGISQGSHSILSSIPIFLLILICTIISFKLIDRYSRRGLLITSILLMTLSHVIMAINLQQHWKPLYTLIPMLLGAGAFTIGFAPLSWIITAEIFPNRIRGKAMGVVCFFLYAASFVTVQVFPTITSWFTIHFNSMAGVYWIFTAVCLTCVWFCWKLVPETKGLTLERISDFWRDRELYKQA
jgi:sugar porter (SP) family MFS transporter